MDFQIVYYLTSIVLGTMLFFSFIVAPTTFKVLDENFARKFCCDIELLYVGNNVLDTEFMDTTVVSLREKLGENYHITSTIIPHTMFKSRRSITNLVINSEGARIVVLPVIDHLVSEFLLHQIVLDASVPVCVLR